MKSEIRLIIQGIMLGILWSAGMAGPAQAITKTGILSVSAINAPGFTLTITGSPLTFPDADPSTTSSIAASNNPLHVSVQVTGGPTSWSLTALATGDLTTGAANIPISNVTWTSTAPFNLSGTLSKTVAQTIASGTGNANIMNHAMNFFLANSWTYATGSYTATVNFTLTGV